jgi:hypothetical protein
MIAAAVKTCLPDYRTRRQPDRTDLPRGELYWRSCFMGMKTWRWGGGLISQRRRGVSIVYVAVSMVVLLGFCSLAVDLGRVQACKTELEVAADAAARAGAANLASGVSSVQSAAAAMASNNRCDGTAVTIDSVNNVVFLNWPSTTPLTGSARSSANAVQINANQSVPLLFGQAIGIRSVIIHATSTAQYTVAAPSSYQVVGLSSVTMNSSNYIDSYNSSDGSYATQTPGSQGSVASNGVVTAYSGSVIHGNVYYSGSAPDINGGTVTGTQTKVPSSLSFSTPTAPASATSLGNINITYSALNKTVSSGNYTCTGITVDSGCTLTINAASGPVNLYCSGSVTGNGGNIAVTGNIPNNFHLYMTNSSSVQMNSGSYWYMVLDAPASAVSLTSSAALYGSVISNTLTVDSGTAIHFDQALGTNGSGSGSGSGTIAQMQ